MAESILSNLRVRGTLAVVGVTTLATLVATTLSVTTLNAVSGEVATLSGTTINVLQPNGTINALTIEAITVSGATVRSLVLSGATLNVGTGIILKDTDGSGCSALHLKNGVVSAQTHDCP